jgi:hypothetical protein
VVIIDTETFISANRQTFHGGFVFDYSLSKKLMLQPELLYSGRGGVFGEDVKTVYRYHSIEMPLNIVYRIEVGEHGRFFLGGGPDLGFNLSGQPFQTDYPVNIIDIELGSGETDTRRVDMGLNVLAGYEFKKRWFISANDNRGLTTWFNNSATAGKWKSNVLAFSVGYFLVRK